MEPTELLLAGLDAMQRGDKEAVREVVHPEIVFHPIRAASFRGKGSQVATTVPTAGIVTFKDGLIAGWHDYGDRAAARDAAGL